MAFIVEDGTGLVNANSYCDLAFAANYFEERNITVWDTFTDDNQKASLIVATDYIEMRFKSQFKGYKYISTQSLSFPSVTIDNKAIDYFIYDVIDPELVIGVETPIAIKRATCEYAIRHAKGGILVNDVDSNQIVPKRVKIGEIETETNTAYNSKRPDLFNVFPTADLLIRPYLKTNSGQVIR
jgi:hypothetical protein